MAQLVDPGVAAGSIQVARRDLLEQNSEDIDPIPFFVLHPAMYALLGEYDLVFIVELENTEKAIKTSIALSILTGISFTTAPAIEVQEFDKIVSS